MFVIKTAARFVLLFLLLIIFCNCKAEDSCHYRISIITLSPGNEVYTVFGHSAIRVLDSTKNDDLVYNYGTFDFDEPNFLIKFINGKLLYYISNEDFPSFLQYYQSEGRTITEQELNLTCKEKYNIVHFLYNNLQGYNKFYKYDFLTDNCTTRLRDLLQKNIEKPIVYKRIVNKQASFRQLLHSDLNYNDHQWLKLGIDILLGSNTDKILTNPQVMFLPDYLLGSLGSAKIGDTRAVKAKVDLSANKEVLESHQFIKDPLFYFIILSLLIFYLTFINKPRINEILLRVDKLLFFLFGLIGCILIYLWVISDQTSYSNNYNLLWAWPFHLIFCFISANKFRWTNYYLKITSIIYGIILISWYFLPQHLNISLIPLISVVMVRSYLKTVRSTESYAGKIL